MLTSEDEPHIHLCPQSRVSGACGAPIVDINTVDLSSVQAEKFETAFPGADPDDSFSAMTSLFQNERNLNLGEGSAEHL